MENYTISSLRAALKAKDISAKEVTEQYLERIEDINPKFNVYVYEGREYALKQAEDADKKIADGEDSTLLGVPMGLKDVFTTKEMPTTACSSILRDYVAPFNAPVVYRLYDAGAICLGKVNTDEFTCGVSTETSCFGPTKNPYDESKVPGGSSGGSAALPTLNMGVFAMATDTGGSIRQPSSLCNSVGLKVTYGRVPRSGVISMASSLDTIGHCVKTVEDAAIILNVTAGDSRMDNTTPKVDVPDYTSFLGKGVKGLKIGVPKEYMDDSIDDEVRETIWSALKVLESQGAELIDIELPLTNYGVAVYYIVSPSEVSANMERYDGIRFGVETKGDVNELMDQYLKNRGEGFGDEMKRRIMVGTYALSSGYYDAYYLKAQKVRTLLINEFTDAFSKVDVIAGPVSPFTAFDIGGKVQDPIAMYMADVLTIPSALAGLPGMSVPAGFDKAGLPIGLQLIAPQFREDLLFQTGSAYEAETEFWKQVPSI
jgi:aspartyl-tRNA(Asn)/glutamyl-tRNA(Gln) amidotransferase subunit A